MKHINITNFEGSITDWTKLNYIAGGIEDDVASLANQTGNKLSKDENGDWQIKDSNGDVIWPTPPTPPGPPAVDTYTTTDFSLDWNTTIIGQGRCAVNTVGRGIHVTEATNNNYVESVSNFRISNINKLVTRFSVIDKGSSSFTWYYSTDGENWTELVKLTATKNNTDIITTNTFSITGPVYLKVKLHCSKTAPSNKGDLWLKEISINI